MRADGHIAILGAGPIGLEAALAAAADGRSFTLYEAGAAVGEHVRRWGHVRLFTPWSMTVSARARAALGDAAPGGEELPDGDAMVREVLEPVAALPAVAPSLRLGTRVVAVAREGLLKHEEIASAERGRRRFRLLVRDASGTERVEHADAVIDATGTYGTPNRLGDGGIPAPGETALDARIDRELVRFGDDAAAWAGRTILLTGSGHSAQTAARDLAAFARDAPGTRVVWALRRDEPDLGAVAGDTLPERAALTRAARELLGGASTAVEVRLGRRTEAVREEGGRLAVTLRNGRAEEVVADRVLALNGGAPDASIYRQLQVHECYASLAPMDLAAALLAQSGAGGDCLAIAAPGPDTLRNPEPGFFILGAKSYGRTSQFLLRTGWQQVDDVFGRLLA
jgi:thioredoxin reductase